MCVLMNRKVAEHESKFKEDGSAFPLQKISVVERKKIDWIESLE